MSALPIDLDESGEPEWVDPLKAPDIADACKGSTTAPRSATYSLPTIGLPVELGLAALGTLAIFDPDAGEGGPGDIVAIWWRTPRPTSAIPLVARLAANPPRWAQSGPKAGVTIDDGRGGLIVHFRWRIERVDRLVGTRD